jgi:hypothetical protein
MYLIKIRFDLIFFSNRTNLTEAVEYGLRHRPRPSTSEIILIIWMSTLLLEEIRQVKIKISSL